ncbi:MAG: outer membrane lipoprotein carrier protein LolA [Pseudomonadota bacterium]
MNKIIQILFLFSIFFFFQSFVVLGQESPAAGPQRLSLDEILNRVENRYAASGFSARFEQVSTIPAMEITETASGRIYVKRPGRMRWEYEKPDLQTVITDGKTLWIYRPEDNQVMIGKAPVFFRDGKGAGFLSDIRGIRRRFLIDLENEIQNNNYKLALYPVEKTFDVSVIYLSISAQTFEVVRIVTYNSYQDKTRIEFSNIRFEEKLDDALFTFKIPEGVEILHLDE